MLGRNRPLATATAAGIATAMPPLWDTPQIVLLAAAVMFALALFTDGPCHHTCQTCYDYRTQIEAHVGEYLPALALWHRVGRPWWRRLLTTIVACSALVFSANTIPVLLLGLPANPTVLIGSALSVFTVLWWMEHHKRLHDLLSDVCPYCR